MTRARHALRATVVLSLAAMLVGGPAMATADPPPYSGPNSVAVPYLGEVQAKPAEGWSFSDCAAVAAATSLVAACEPQGITFAASEYDPDAGTTIIPVTLGNGGLTITVDYFVRLAAPPLPTLAEGPYGYPFAAGSHVLIPFSDLGIECTVCREAMSVVVDSVSPRSAGTATATATHVVFSASPEFVGAAEVSLVVLDDFGQQSAAASLELAFYQAGDSHLAAAHVYRALEPTGSTALDLSTLAVASGDEPLRLIGCGPAVHGTVMCSPDGTAEYHPTSSAKVDQFSFHVVSESGEQATGSVTLVRPSADDTAASAGPVPSAGAGAEGPASLLVPRTPPPEGAAAETPGLFDHFTRLLDRVGA